MFPSSWRQQDGHCSGYKTGSVPLTRLRRIVFPRAQFFFLVRPCSCNFVSFRPRSAHFLSIHADAVMTAARMSRKTSFVLLIHECPMVQ